MKERIKISIVIPAYNIERYILRCLKSVFAQNYSNFEAVIINDGSTDETGKIIEEYISDKPNFKLTTRENGGLSCARNTGIDLCTGDYIMFLDGDDEIEPNTLSELASEIESNSLDAVFFDAVIISEDGKIDNELSHQYNRPDISKGIKSGEKLFAEFMKKHEMLVCACFYVFRKSIIDKANLRFMPGLLHEDCLFTPGLMRDCKSVKHINKQYYRYYNNSNSIMTSKTYYKEAQNYGIVTEKLLSNYPDSGFSFLVRHYFREYCLIMYNMGKAALAHIPNPDKDLQRLYSELDIEVNAVKSRMRLFVFFHKLIVYPRIILKRLVR